MFKRGGLEVLMMSSDGRVGFQKWDGRTQNISPNLDLNRLMVSDAQHPSMRLQIAFLLSRITQLEATNAAVVAHANGRV